MAIALLKNSTITVRKESTYGVAPGSIDKSNAIEVSGVPEFNDTFETIERDVIRNSFSTFAPIRGLESTSGSLSIELHGSGIHGQPPESDVLWECAMGYKLIGGTGTVQGVGTSSSYATSYFAIDVTVGAGEAANFHLGAAVVIYDGSNNIIGEGFINAIDTGTDTITVISKTDFSGSLSNGQTISEGIIYSLKDASGNVGDLPSFTLDFWRGDITREQYTGNIITSFELNMESGQIVTPTFSWEGKTVTYTASDFNTDVPTGTLQYDSVIANPLIARDVELIITNGTDVFTMPVSTLNITLTNEITKLQAIDTSGIFRVVRIKRSITGTLNTFYEGKDFQDAFKAEATYELRGILGDNLGNKFAFSAPRLKFSEIPLSEDNGIFKYDASFSLEPVNGDDELILQFL